MVRVGRTVEQATTDPGSQLGYAKEGLYVRQVYKMKFNLTLSHNSLFKGGEEDRGVMFKKQDFCKSCLEVFELVWQKYAPIFVLDICKKGVKSFNI